ncbi:hypothetical protein M409DRAFT_29046 [Zasmidium cellare ATCC 36951]|uniref:Uncharacterized protein n=1 Tax=Zasmidium cellare ATCC 36951 TaxID=1080233 RepID=A0A6A6C0M1_ZASCE|nr:uncharacterized protein M409DRAFT_29046 [Zasmidium cellare ATCC 36951]KAF2160423.1 hypothetical protein M409DRAFT_29046 [Zasmidium cellare ATCC 36951]
MGKAGRIACIFTPMALTLASFICLILIEVAGWNKGTLTSYSFFQANLTNLTAGSSSSNSVISLAIDSVKSDGSLAEVYDIYLSNYCSSNSTDGKLDYCSKRESQFVFDPLDVFGFTITNGTNATSTSSSDNAVESAINSAKDNIDDYEDEILGSSGRKALNAYKKVAKWMWIAYQISFWTTLATLILGILAIFSRWGSFITWILSFVSSLFNIAAVLTSTILFAILVSALNEALKDYGIKFSLGHQALTVTWLSVAFSWAATLFWLFSVCCCSGRSNPHHRSNKGGLWNAAPKDPYARGRGLQVEKTGGFAGNGYQRVASPYQGGHDDQVPLQEYGQPNPYSAPTTTHNHQHQGVGFEPYRHA